MHILVIPAWYEISNPMSGIFFHEYCNALSTKCKVTLLDFNYLSFKERFTKTQKTDLVGDKNYRRLSVDYYSPLPGKLLSITAGFQRRQILNKAYAVVKNYERLNAKIDVIHIQSVCNNITPVIAQNLSLRLNVPYLVTEHYTSFKEAGEGIFYPFTSFAEVKEIVKKANARIGVSKLACDYFKGCFEAEFEKIYNVIPDEFANASFDNKSSDKFEFVCIGSLQKRKGQAFLLKAFSNVHQKIENASLTFIGDGPDKAMLVDYSEQLGIKDKVNFTGNLGKQEIIKHIDEASVIVSASEKETFGLTIAEALVRGKPVIAVKSGGPEELISSENGLLSPINDLVSMSNNLEFIYSNYSNYNSEKIREEALKKYSAAAIMPLMIEKYKNALKN